MILEGTQTAEEANEDIPRGKQDTVLSKDNKDFYDTLDQATKDQWDEIGSHGIRIKKDSKGFSAYKPGTKFTFGPYESFPVMYFEIKAQLPDVVAAEPIDEESAEAADAETETSLCPVCGSEVDEELLGVDSTGQQYLPELAPTIEEKHKPMALAILRRYNIIQQIQKLESKRDAETELIDGYMHKFMGDLITNEKKEKIFVVGDIEGVLKSTVTEKVHTRKRTVPERD